jgi:hypothetical protein
MYTILRSLPCNNYRTSRILTNEALQELQAQLLQNAWPYNGICENELN